MPPRPKRSGYPYYQISMGPEIPREFYELIKRRVGGLISFSTGHKPLIYLLANAYLFGLKDAMQVLESTHTQSRTIPVP